MESEPPVEFSHTQPDVLKATTAIAWKPALACKADAVVRNRKLQQGGYRSQAHCDEARIRVLLDIGQRFLRNSEQGLLMLLTGSDILSLDFHRDREIGDASKGCGHCLKRCWQGARPKRRHSLPRTNGPDLAVQLLNNRIELEEQRSAIRALNCLSKACET